MDVFAEHGIAGMVGLTFNALFAADYIIGLDGVNTGVINGGWLNHNYRQLYVQVAYIVACTGYAFVMSAILALIINFIPGLHLRAVMACWNSCLAAMFGSITWCLLDYRLARKWSMVGWCSGCISGLVAATPASGFITPWASVILGIVTGIVANFATKRKLSVRHKLWFIRI